MFKKLRNKFLLINLVTISIMMIIAFASIYLITYNNVHRDINMELRKISEFNQGGKDGPKEPRQISDMVEYPQERSLSFSLIIGNDGTIQSYFSVFNMDEEFYKAAKEQALSSYKNIGEFRLEGTHWAYIIKDHPQGSKIVFLDVTSQQGILINLIYTFLMVALVTLFFIFFISKYFANKSIEPIKNAFDKQKQFIADASHELRTPLAVINTNVDVLLSNGEDNINNQLKWLHYIKSEVERMSKLTKDLLYLTQMDYSDIKMIFSDFNLSEAVENVILTMEAVIFENHISLKYDIEPNLKVNGNSEQIKQVVMILLDNALKYTNEKGTVEITLKKHQNNMILSVMNTGNGIPEKYMNEIFERFYRIDKSRSRNNGGYGLGLAIAKAIVEQHRGKIYVKSVVEKSSTFTVELPS